MKFACTHVGVSHTCLMPQRSAEGVRSSGVGVIDGYELPCRCWEVNPRRIQEQLLSHLSSSRLISFKLTHLNSIFLNLAEKEVILKDTVSSFIDSSSPTIPFSSKHNKRIKLKI